MELVSNKEYMTENKDESVNSESVVVSQDAPSDQEALKAKSVDPDGYWRDYTEFLVNLA